MVGTMEAGIILVNATTAVVAIAVAGAVVVAIAGVPSGKTTKQTGYFYVRRERGVSPCG